MEIAESNKAMWKGALFPSLILSALSILISTVLLGSSGFFGSLLASFTVVIFFSVSLLVSRLTKSADPISTMALAMFSYFTKLLLIAGFLIAVTRLTDEGDVDRTAFGVSALIVATGWLAGEVRSFFRLRLQLPLPQQESQQQETSSQE
jgi:ATP synthase protein I